MTTPVLAREAIVRAIGPLNDEFSLAFFVFW